MGNAYAPTALATDIVNIDPSTCPVATVGSWELLADGNTLPNGYNVNISAALGDSIAWDITVPNGKWSIDMVCTEYTDGGIVSVQLDDGNGNFTSYGTIDQYVASVTYNVRASFGPVQILGGNVRRLLLILVDKNPASSAYTARITTLQFRRLFH